MTKLPERRDPGDRIVLKPREDLPDSVPTKLPEQHDPRVLCAARGGYGQ